MEPSPTRSDTQHSRHIEYTNAIEWRSILCWVPTGGEQTLLLLSLLSLLVLCEERRNSSEHYVCKWEVGGRKRNRGCKGTPHPPTTIISICKIIGSLK